MAEVDAAVRGRAEPPGRTRNRRRLFDDRIASARTTGHMLMALTSYIRGMFAEYSADEVQVLCHRLAEAADDERRRLRGT